MEPVSENFVARKKVSVKFGLGKKSRNRYRKNLVPKEVPVSVSKILSAGKKYRYRYRPRFWVPSHTDEYDHDLTKRCFHMVLFPVSKRKSTRSYFMINPPREGRQVAEGCAVGGQ